MNSGMFFVRLLLLLISYPSITYAQQVADTASLFRNPLLQSGPDPWVIRHNSFYYYMHTTGVDIVMYKTRKMSDLGKAKQVRIWTPPAKGPNARDIWAPELHRINNTWYIYYTAGSSDSIHPQHLFVMENKADDPTTGTWVDKGQLKDPAADNFALDATVFKYKGQHYFIWSGHNGKDNLQRLYIARMQNPWTMATHRVEIAAPIYDWEKDGIPVNEGPEILESPKGDIFLVYSASACWTESYALGIIKLKKGADPLDPANWTKMPTPYLTTNKENGAFGPGHNGFFKSPDGKEDWIIYHANSKAGQGCGGHRNPRIQKINWQPDGMPDFGVPVSINQPIRKPSGE